MRQHRILHVISGLDIGGAETMLYRLLAHMDRCRWQSKVISLKTLGPIGEKIERLGIPVASLGLEDLKTLRLKHFRALRRLTEEFCPDVVQGWMYHGNLAAYLGNARRWNGASILWNIRQTLPAITNEKRTTRAVIRVGGLLSNQIDTIIFNSEASVSEHQRVGFADRKSVVIPNGVEARSPDFLQEHRKRARRALNIREDEKVFVSVGRYHPKKDQMSFIRASAGVVKEVSKARFVMIGREVTCRNLNLYRELERLGLLSRFEMLGERQDVLELVAAADVFVSSSSWGEGFSNAIAEAMSIGVPCVATDVGESRRIIGGTGMVVAPGDSDLLAQEMILAASMPREALFNLGEAARSRVLELYSIGKVADEYSNLYTSFTSDRG